MKTVFFGTPAVAVPFLERLARASQVIGVVCSPDKPAGRGYHVTPPPVKAAARALGLPLRQPERLAEFSLEREFGARPDVGIVVAYGHLIPPALFNEPRLGLVNVHFSLVPKYRGAGPLQWALIRGETETGVSLFRIEKGLDTGPVFLQRSLPINPADNVATLRERLAVLGLNLQDELICDLEKGSVVSRPQTGEAVPAPLLKKEDGEIHWARQTAAQIVNLIRGAFEWPGAFARVKGARLKIRAAQARPEGNGRPGEVLAVEKGRGFLVKCLSDSLLVSRVQPEGKKEMDAESFWNGARLKAGDVFE